MNRSNLRLSWLAVLLLPACSYYSGDGSGASPDATLEFDGGGGPVPDAAVTCSNAIDLLPTGWKPVDTVSPGKLSDTAGMLMVDASAGGSAAAASEPFLYLKFGADAVTKVEIGDRDSFSSTAWDLALKRYVIRTNGGDSGPGGGAIAAVQADSLDLVTVPPADSRFKLDDWTNPDCSYAHDNIGGPLTGFSDWYAVNAGKLEPRPYVYVVKLPDRYIKLKIDTYYGNPDAPNQSAVFQISWATL